MTDLNHLSYLFLIWPAVWCDLHCTGKVTYQEFYKVLQDHRRVMRERFYDEAHAKKKAWKGVC